MEELKTAYAQATDLVASGKTLAEVKAALVASGLDEESATVVVNALPASERPAVPQAQLSLTTNALAPDLFSVSELGLQGDAATVGLYWLTFGLVLLVVVGLVVFVPMPELFGDEGPSESFLYFVEVVLPKVGFGVSAVACARGGYLLTRAGFRVRRR